MSDVLSSPFIIPVVGTIFGTMMTAVIVAIVFWHRGREKELQAHQEMRIREMDHQRRMKELELEIERTKARQSPERVA